MFYALNIDTLLEDHDDSWNINHVCFAENKPEVVTIFLGNPAPNGESLTSQIIS